MSDTVAAFLAECDVLDGLVAGFDEAGWRAETPAVGWTVAHQIAHLAWTDEVASLTATGSVEFAAVLAEAARDPYGYVDRVAQEGAGARPAQILARWRRSRSSLAQALDSADPASRMPWFGPPMTPRSMATARLMETWAHGQDVADTFGVRRPATARLRDVAHLGVRTRDFSYRINGLMPPEQEFRVELTGPDGDLWEWGPVDATDRVSGPAEDFCLVVTQRRPVGDTGLTATGEAARWLEVAQAFAGPPKRPAL